MARQRKRPHTSTKVSGRPLKNRPTSAARKREPASVEAIMAMLFVGLIAYFGAEFSLANKPHPTHWLVALLFAGIGYAGGAMWHRVKEPF